MAERQDIVSGLRNAIDRGYSIELAVQSFMNAGYSKQDVLDSAKVLGFNTNIISRISPLQIPQIQAQQTQIPQPEIPEITPKPTEQIQSQLSSPQQIQNSQKSWFRKNWLVILLAAILAVLLTGLFISILAGDWVSSLLGLG